MATNFYFNNYKNSGEQDLLEDLIVEAIKIYGEDMYYITRNINNLDKLYTADDQSSYTNAYLVEFYIKSIDGFGGDGNFMSKFGLEIHDQIVLSIAQRTFSKEIGAYTTLVRPNEGDLIYFPLNNKCFQIKFVNKFEMFYQLGALQTWEMTCELFSYSDEVFNTGIPEIDRIQQLESTNVLDFTIKDEQGNWITDENGNYIVMEQYNLDTITGTGTNQTIANESAGFIDFSQTDPFSEGVDV
jgi:Virus neck protein